MLDLPTEFVERMKTQLSNESAAFFASLETPSPTSIRLHHLKGRTSFDKKEKVPWCNSGYYLETRPFFHLDPYWHAGTYYVQEASSMILDHVISQLSLDQQSRIWLDLCAAPGGKTGILASHMGPEDVLVANEVVSQRRAILRENLTRAGYVNTFISGEPASSFQDPFADIILIDAPCAGEGMMRKEPEAIRQWTSSLVQSCSLMQKDIVMDAVRALKADGILIYSTCSYSMDENLRNIGYFISRHNLEPVSLSFPDEWGITTLIDGEAIGYQLYPHKVKGEGLFVAVLKNTSPEQPLYQRQRKPFSLFEPVPAWMAPHLADHETMRVQRNNSLHHFVTAVAETTANNVLMHLPRAEAIATAGELKGKDFIPAHVLAMAGQQGAHYGIIDLDLSGALDFLERAVHSLPSGKPPGWYLASYNGTSLGWVKCTMQGWKNHYPMNWRLRDRKPK